MHADGTSDCFDIASGCDCMYGLDMLSWAVLGLDWTDVVIGRHMA